MKMLFKIKEQSPIARLAAWKLKSNNAAIVIGKTIHLHNASKNEFLQNKRWLCHELKHIEQFRHHGFVPFIVKYIAESIRHGYSNNKFEKEARLAEKDERLMKNMELIEKRKTKQHG